MDRSLLDSDDFADGDEAMLELLEVFKLLGVDGALSLRGLDFSGVYVRWGPSLVVPKVGSVTAVVERTSKPEDELLDDSTSM